MSKRSDVGEGSSTSRKPPHPLKQPYREVDSTPICRFHNYRICQEGSECPYNHNHCHICLKEGHIALDCDQYVDEDLFRKFQETYTLKNTRRVDKVKRTLLKQRILGWDPTIPTRDDLQLYRCRKHKRWEADRLKELSQGTTFVDVGAHYGDTVVTMAIFARANGREDLKFVAIEPCSSKCEWIQNIAKINQLEITTIQACVGHSATQWVEPCGTHKQLIQGNMKYEAVVEEPTSQAERDGDVCPMITLDSIRDQLGPVGILHLDVEGWEAQALEGATELLSNTNTLCWIVAEVWDKRHAQSADPEKAVQSTMQQHLHFVRQDELIDQERNMIYVCRPSRDGDDES